MTDEAAPATLHFCRGEHCPGLKWPASVLAHPRTCLAKPASWPGAAASDGEATARVAGDGRVEVLNPAGEVLTTSTWTVPFPITPEDSAQRTVERAMQQAQDWTPYLPHILDSVGGRRPMTAVDEVLAELDRRFPNARGRDLDVDDVRSLSTADDADASLIAAAFALLREIRETTNKET